MSGGILNTTDAGRLLGCHRNTVKRMIAAGKLTGWKVGDEWRLRESDVLAYLGQPVAKQEAVS